MGNREDLLAGAKKCLIERGWARTTVRDIAAAAGVNHAAIGYHFGSREALLTQAVMAAMDDLGEETAGLVADDDPERRWQAIIDTFTTHRTLWLAQLEAVLQAEHNEEIRVHLAAGQREARDGLGGSVPNAIVLGLLVQQLVDPDTAPDGAAVAAAIRALKP